MLYHDWWKESGTFSFRLAVMGIGGCWYLVQGKGGADPLTRCLIAIIGGRLGEHMRELGGLDLGFIGRNLACYKS